jgi:hypothetical protein
MTPEAIWVKLAEEISLDELESWIVEEGWSLGPADPARVIHDAIVLSIAEHDHGDLTESQLRDDVRHQLRTIRVRYAGSPSDRLSTTVSTSTEAITSTTPVSAVGRAREEAFA